MSTSRKSDLNFDKTYKVWLTDIKARVRSAQIKAAAKVNVELLNLYWWLGGDIVEKQAKSKWGDGLIDQLNKDLSSEFSDMKGFSKRNLELVRQWYLFYSRPKISGQQPVGPITKQAVSQIKQIPWGHNIVIVYKSKDIEEALFYVQKTIIHNWSRSILIHLLPKKLKSSLPTIEEIEKELSKI